MSTNDEAPPLLGDDPPRKDRRRRPSGLLTLMALVACCGVLFWAWRHVSPNLDPTLAVARSIQRQSILDLRSGDPARRIEAVRTLENLDVADEAASVASLLGSIDDPAGEVRAAAIRALGSLVSALQSTRRDGTAGEETARALLGCVMDADEGARIATVRALGLIAKGLSDSGTGAETVEAATTALLGRLKDPAPGVRTAATSWLRTAAPRLDPGVVKGELAELVRDPDAGVRRAAIMATTSSRPSDDGPPEALVAAFDDAAFENRRAALEQLWHYQSLHPGNLDRLVPILFRLVEHEPAPAVRDQCGLLMRSLLTPPAITASSLPALLAGLKSEDAIARGLAAQILGSLKDGAFATVPELIRTLNEPLAPDWASNQRFAWSDDPARAAAGALGRIAPESAMEKEAVAALIAAARSGPPFRRSGAIRALMQFGAAAEEAVPVLITILDEDRAKFEAQVVDALTGIAPDTPSAGRAVGALLPGLRAESPSSRIRAVEALTRFAPGSSAAVDGIRSLKDDPDDRVRKAAANALDVIEMTVAP
jgi:HEAT repeat protein